MFFFFEPLCRRDEVAQGAFEVHLRASFAPLFEAKPRCDPPRGAGPGFRLAQQKRAPAAALAVGAVAYMGKLAVGGFLLALFETSIAKMRVFRVPEFLLIL